MNKKESNKKKEVRKPSFWQKIKVFWGKSWKGILISILVVLMVLFLLPFAIKLVKTSWNAILQTPQQPVVQQPVVAPQGQVQKVVARAEPATVQSVISDPIGNTVFDFGDFGSYQVVYDTNRNMYTLGWWNENMVQPGTKNLADLKRDGGKISFTVPADCWINNSAGALFVDGIEWDLGNYGEADRISETTLIKKGQKITVEYQPGNDSAGFQLWFKP